MEKKENFYTIIVHIVLMTLVLFWLFPLAYMVFSSFKPNSEVVAKFWPSHFTVQNYVDLYLGNEGSIPISITIFNSLFVASVQTLLFVGLCAISGYTLAKVPFRGQGFFKQFVIYQMLFPGILFLIPQFLLVKYMGLYNTYGGMIIVSLLGAQGVYLYQQFFKSIPNEIISAARMDGASELRIVWNIILPLSLPTTAFVAVFQFMGRWDEFLWNFIIVQDKEYMTLPVFIAGFVNGGHGSYYGLKMAAASILTVPILILFFMMRKTFVKGLVAGSLK